MSKANEKAKTLFAKPMKQKKKNFQESFENPSRQTNPIEALFETHKLSYDEKQGIRSLISNRYKTDGVEKSQLDEDLTNLLELSSQIRAITKQSLILHGERIAKGQKILTKYKRGAFTAWLELTYGNRQTPYNFLYYYTLYRELPPKTKPLFQKIPYRAAYVLGARAGSLENKVAIIEKHYKESQKDLLVLIEKSFPLNRMDRRVTANSNLKLIDSALDSLKIISARKENLNSQVVEKLKQMSLLLNTVLSDL